MIELNFGGNDQHPRALLGRQSLLREEQRPIVDFGPAAIIRKPRLLAHLLEREFSIGDGRERLLCEREPKAAVPYPIAEGLHVRHHPAVPAAAYIALESAIQRGELLRRHALLVLVAQFEQ